MPIDLTKTQPLTNSLPTKPRKHTFLFGILIFGLLIAIISQLVVRRNPLVSPPSYPQPETPSIKAPVPTAIKKEVIGFLPSWMVAQNVPVSPERLDQIIYFGLGINDQGELMKYDTTGNSLLEWTYFTSKYFRVLQEKAASQGTKIVVSIKMLDNATIDTLISSPTKVDIAVRQIQRLVEEYHLDGINLDFEYVTDSRFPTLLYLNRFVETLVSRLKQRKPALIISFDINATAVFQDNAYDVVKIGELVDQVILMAYDYNRAPSSRAGPVAPIEGEKNEHSITQSLLSLRGRIPKEKIILGVPFYGYEWQTTSKYHKSQTVAQTGALATYKRVRELIENRNDIYLSWDMKAQSPWLIYDQNGLIKQIYYENETSLTKKLELIINEQLGGIAIWALGYEGNYTELWSVIQEKFRS